MWVRTRLLVLLHQLALLVLEPLKCRAGKSRFLRIQGRQLILETPVPAAQQVVVVV